jgi:hypothetical protein
MSTPYPPVQCKCGGSAHYIGMQVMRPLGLQYPMYECDTCLSSMGGKKESLPPTDDKAVQS